MIKKICLYLTLIGLLTLNYPLTFSDLYTGSTTASDMLLKYGFIDGTNGNPHVSDPLTRAQIAVILSNLNGTKDAASVFALPPNFKDVDPNSWYSPYISYGQTYGYLGGYPDGTYKPNQNVSAQEFAAFMMNVLGYNGDYNYNNVIHFASSKGVHVTVSGNTFLRGDAFNALWETVNQPVKGSKLSIGQKLGRFENTEASDYDVDIYKPSVADLSDEKNLDDFVYEIKFSDANSIDVCFQHAIEDSDHVVFKLKRDSWQQNHDQYDVYYTVSWNIANTVATIETGTAFEIADYEITIKDATGTTPVEYGPYSIRYKENEVDDFVLESEYLNRINEYMGTIAFKVYDKYDNDITNTDMAKNLQIQTTTSVSTPVVSYSEGVITVQQGSYGSTTNKLSDIPYFLIIVTDPDTGFYFSKRIIVSDTASGIEMVKIFGVVDVDGNSKTLVYDPDQDYYLDVAVIDINGNKIKSNSLLTAINESGDDAIKVTSGNESLITVTKTTHPDNSDEIAFKINFVEKPSYATPILFTAYSPLAVDGNDLATFMTTLRLSE